jgi:hypothetical protein
VRMLGFVSRHGHAVCIMRSMACVFLWVGR